MTNNQQIILKTLIYSDIFDFPLTIAELERYALGKLEGNWQEDLHQSNFWETKDEYIFLAGRQEIINLRKEAEKYTKTKLQKTKKWLRILKFIPWVKLVAVTGEVAANNAQADDDIDLLIITSPNRLWLSRFLALSLFQLLGQRVNVKRNQLADRFCFNRFLTTGQLQRPPGLFLANEISRIKIIYEVKNCYQNFILSNPWISKFLPQWWEEKTKELHPSNKRVLKQNKSLFLFNLLENWVKNLQIRNAFKKGLSEENLLFPQKDNRQWIEKEFKERLEKFS